MHLVEIHKIEYHPESKGYILILEKSEGDLKIPILIGSNEAQSLSLAQFLPILRGRPLAPPLLLDPRNRRACSKVRSLAGYLDVSAIFGRCVL